MTFLYEVTDSNVKLRMAVLIVFMLYIVYSTLKTIKSELGTIIEYNNEFALQLITYRWGFSNLRWGIWSLTAQIEILLSK